jgi:putrescine transport system permease protein
MASIAAPAASAPARAARPSIDWGRVVVIAIPFLWLAALFLVPFFIVVKISLSYPAISMPPYEPQFDIAQGWAGVTAFLSELTVENYQRLIEDPLYVRSYLSSLQIAAISTLFVLLIGYPMAYAMARAPKGWRPFLMVAVILPFFSSLLIRVYAWVAILKPEGLLNLALSWIGVVGTETVNGVTTFVDPVNVFNSPTAVIIGIVYSYLPFMVLPLYATLEKLDDTLLEAAQDLGCTQIGAFWRVTFPLSIPGIIAGCLLVFIPAIGEYVIPDLLGGSSTLMIGKQLVNEFYANRDWPAASAVAVVLLILLVVPIVLYQQQQAGQIEAVK